MGKKFKCAACDGEFEAGLSDEEAEAQLATEFPGFAPEDCAVICDDCFNRGVARHPELIGGGKSLQ